MKALVIAPLDLGSSWRQIDMVISVGKLKAKLHDEVCFSALEMRSLGRASVEAVDSCRSRRRFRGSSVFVKSIRCEARVGQGFTDRFSYLLRLADEKVLTKVIIETCLLTDEEKTAACCLASRFTWPGVL
jgi:hypothetical protein